MNRDRIFKAVGVATGVVGAIVLWFIVSAYISLLIFKDEEVAAHAAPLVGFIIGLAGVCGWAYYTKGDA